MTDLTAFVPRLAAELGAIGGSHWTSVEGSMLSADISGFTALSERLAGKGKAGAEEITELINTCFTALIDSAYDYGGEVIKFGGDALLVLFRGDDHMRRVVSAGQAMQHALHSSPTARRAKLTMTVGAAEGPFDVFVAGSGYRELLITGTRATEVIHLEGEAAKGETLVSPALADLLPAEMLGRSHAGGHEVIGRTSDPTTGPAKREFGDVDLNAFVPPAVLEQFGAFESLGGEHRLVTVGFVMVTGISSEIERVGPDGAAATLGQLVDDLMEATTPFGVTVLHTDIAPDGVKFVLCAGAPVNPGDTGDALLEAALRVAQIESALVIRQGVQTGRVFAGFLGSPYRRTYTLMGDPVNTAARMIGKARDREVVAVATVVDDTRTVFDTTELEPFLVKGKTEPIVAHKVHATSDMVRRQGSATRLVGRRVELDELTKAIGELGEVIVLRGPAGVGKSRLLDAAWDMAEGLSIFQAACTPYGAASPYSVFRALLRTGAGIAPTADPKEAGRQLSRFIRTTAPHLVSSIPLLALPFGATVKSTPEFTAIEPEFLRGRIHDVVVEFLDATLSGPTMLVVEDLHWVDDASGELVSHLARAATSRPWAALLTARPGGSWEPAENVAHMTVLDLEPLNDDDIRQLALHTSNRPFTDNELDEITTRAAGNPLFAIELTNAIDSGSLDGLPESVEGVISTRIDSLEPSARRLVRIASVFGQSFTVEELRPVLETEAPELELELDRRGIGDLIEPGRDGTLRFTHALYRDVAYEGLPFRRRTHLHGVIGTSLEGRAADPESIAALLSLHFSEARERDKAWRYSLVAGESASGAGANSEAAVAFERGLRAIPKSVDLEQRSMIQERLGDVQTLNGRLQRADAAFRRARANTSNLQSDLRLMRKLGDLAERDGKSSQALRWYSRALAKLPGHADDWTSVEQARLLLASAGVKHRQGRHRTCLALAETAARVSRDSSDTAVRALAHDRQFVALVYLSEQDHENHGERALELYRQVGDSNAEARILNNLGIASYYRGDWSAAAQRYSQAVEKSHAAGNVIESGFGALNQAEILADQGHWDRAAAVLDDVLRNWTAVEYLPGVAIALAYRGLAIGRAGETEDSQEALDEAIERFIRIGSSELVGEAKVRLAEILLVANDTVRAMEHLDHLAETASEKPALDRRVKALRSIALAQAGEDMSTQWRGLVNEASPDYETALALDLLARREKIFEPLSAEVNTKLGIARLPDIPIGA